MGAAHELSSLMNELLASAHIEARVLQATPLQQLEWGYLHLKCDPSD